MAHNITTSFVESNVPRLLRDLVLPATSVDRGVFQIVEGYHKQINMNRFYTQGLNIKAKTSKFDPANNADATTKDEKKIVLTAIEQQDEVDPTAYNLDWPSNWSTGMSANPALARPIVDALMPSVAENFNNTLELCLWQGDTAGGAGNSLDLFDGLIKKIDADASVNNADGAGLGSEITDTNAITAFTRTLAAVPAEVREMSDFAFVCSHSTKYRYLQATQDADFKGPERDELGRPLFSGYPIISTHGIPGNTRIFAMITGGGERCECKLGMWMNSDRFNIEFGKGHDLDKVIGYIINAEVGVEYVYGKQITELTALL